MPGGPNSSTPLGILAPMARNLAGDSKNSLISWSSSTASSAPATSAKVTLGWSLFTCLALALPNCITRLPPPCMVFMTNRKAPISSTKGRNVCRIVHQMGSRWWSTLVSTSPWRRTSSTFSASSRT